MTLFRISDDLAYRMVRKGPAKSSFGWELDVVSTGKVLRSGRHYRDIYDVIYTGPPVARIRRNAEAAQRATLYVNPPIVYRGRSFNPPIMDAYQPRKNKRLRYVPMFHAEYGMDGTVLTVSAGPEVEFAASSPGAAVVASYRENGLKNDIDGWITDGMIHVPLPWGPTLVIDSDDGTYRLREGGMELLLHGRLHQPPMAPLSVVLAVVRMEGLP